MIQEKSKAKKRYLRRKKERRKARAKTMASVEATKSDEGTGSMREFDMQEDRVGKVMEPTVQVAKSEKRPKKRHKVAGEPKDVEKRGVDDALDLEPLLEPLEKLSQPLSPEITLPLFPLPTVPEPPSRSVLALQGIDQGLIDAEIIDPKVTVPIPDGDDDGGTGLSEKTRKRLRNLGIAELFAGMLLYTTLVAGILLKHSLRSSNEGFTLPSSEGSSPTSSLSSVQPSS
jgi:ATP-dependent RNA helicase DDX51/DBP6